MLTKSYIGPFGLSALYFALYYNSYSEILIKRVHCQHLNLSSLWHFWLWFPTLIPSPINKSNSQKIISQYKVR